MATMFEALGSERTLADHLLPLLSSLLTIVHTSHMQEKGPELKSQKAWVNLSTTPDVAIG